MPMPLGAYSELMRITRPTGMMAAHACCRRKVNHVPRYAISHSRAPNWSTKIAPSLLMPCPSATASQSRNRYTSASIRSFTDSAPGNTWLTRNTVHARPTSVAKICETMPGSHRCLARMTPRVTARNTTQMSRPRPSAHSAALSAQTASTWMMRSKK